MLTVLSYIRVSAGKCFRSCIVSSENQPINHYTTFSCTPLLLNLFDMGNSESVIVSRNDRKRKSGRRRDGRPVPVDHEYHYRNGHQHTPSLDSDASSRRSKRKVRYPESKSSSDTDVKRHNGSRYSKDYSLGGRAAKDYVVDHGYVVPGYYPNTKPEVRVKQNQMGVVKLATGVAYDSAGPKQRPQHIPNLRGRYVPKPQQPTYFIPISEGNGHTHSADQPSRHYRRTANLAMVS